MSPAPRAVLAPRAAVAASISIATVLSVAIAMSPASATKPGSGASTGAARVFMVNPVQSSGDESLTDQKDSASAVPASAYATVELRNLDGSGYLSGKWATVRSNTGAAAYSTTNTFAYTRNQDQFEQVMAYFWVNQAEEYLQSLGFRPGGPLPAILARPFPVRIDQYGVDNSFFTSDQDYLRLGKGGVDDAEDAEVIDHEYGHAIQNDQVPDFGSSEEAGSIGEAFGDYFGVSVGLAAAKQYGWPVKADPACPMDWDSTSYTSAPHCIRRFDRNLTTADKTGEVHHDGQIWSQALWEIRKDYGALGKPATAWDTTLIDAQFSFAPDTSFSDAAKATYQAALARDGKAAANAVRDRFAARGITFTI
jgi:hypothetical protein